MNDIQADAKTIFLEALDYNGPDELRRFLEQACGSDAALRMRVEELLRAHRDAGAFLGGGERQGATCAPPRAESLGTVIGPYKLLQQIGEGGMGTVFMAEQTQPVQRKVALKVIKPGMDSGQVIARFEAERQALALMDHVNIARVFDGGATDTGRPYFVMELIHGVPITKYCDDNLLTPRERLELFVPVCQALQHAHQKGIIHRDIKPSNVMVTLYDGKPVPKVIDFGVAKATEQKLTERTLFTQYGTLVGTLEYMSPEQAELSALGVDTRSDIYSLGVLLYELLTGSTPLSHQRVKGAAYAEILRLIKEEEPAKPSTRLSDSGAALASISAQRKTEPAKLSKLMRGELDWIAMKALEKDRSRRYETANGLAQDVQRYLNDEAVQACPPTPGYRLRKFARKYRMPLRVAGACLVLLVASVIVSAWQAVRAMQAETVATVERDRAIQAKQDMRKALAETQQARTETEQALKTSEEARQQAQAVSNFMVGAFRSPDPRQRSPEIKAVYILDRAAADLQAHFSDLPNTKGDFLDALGRSYASLGLAANAVAMHEKARALRQAVLGADHPDTLVSMNRLSMAYREAKQPAEALSLAEETLQRRQATLGPYHPETLRSMHDLAQIYGDAAQRWPEAMRLYEETLRLQKAKLPPNHLDTRNTMIDLAFIYQNLRRLDEALALVEETLEITKAEFGPHHPDTLNNMHNLATVYRAAGRLNEAQALYQETLELFKTKVRPDHPEALDIILQSAGTAEQQGDFAKAERFLIDLVALRRKRDGPNHPETAVALQRLGVHYLKREKYAAAEPVLRELVAGHEKLPPNSWAPFQAKARLGLALLGQKKYAEAEPFLVEGYAGLKERAAEIPASEKESLTEALNRLIELYDAWGQQDKADAWRKRLQSSPVGLLTEARAHLKSGLWDQAATRFSEIFDLSSYTSDGWDNSRERACREVAACEPVFTRVVRLRPKDPRIWIGRGRHLAVEQKWAAAADAYGKAIHSLPLNYLEHFEYACVLALVDDRPNAQKQTHVQRLLEGAPTATDRAAFIMARTFGLISDPAVPAAQIIGLAKQAVKANASAFHIHALALAHYRAGEFELAIQQARESDVKPWTNAAKPQNWLVLALAHHRLGHAAEAKAWLDKALPAIDLENAANRGKPLSVSVPDWLELQVLRREAEATGRPAQETNKQ
jgi:eukaryotic-like serine/threonine-protein kinase